MTCTQESKFLEEYKILGHVKEAQQDYIRDREVVKSYIPEESNLHSYCHDSLTFLTADMMWEIRYLFCCKKETYVISILEVRYKIKWL